MFAEERQRKIYDLICEQKSVRVQQLSELLDISEVTIRRDLDELHKQKKILRTHGGAVAYYPVGRGINVPDLLADEKQRNQKEAIARLAYEYINDYDTILLDGSSTVFELVKLIAKNEKHHLIVITTSALSVMTLASLQDSQVMMVGGSVSYLHNTVEGHIANQFIKGIRVDKCFFGVNGIDETFGFSTPRFEDAELKSLAIASARQSFILADHTKFGKVYLARIEGSVDFLVTDRMADGYPYEIFDPQTTVLFTNEQKGK